MKPQGKAILAAGILIIGAFACFKDPVGGLQGDPNRVGLSTKFLQQNVGDTNIVSVQVLDQQGNPLQLGTVTLTPVDNNVADAAVLPDTSFNFPGQTLIKIIVFAKNAGTTKIAVSALGVVDTMTIIAYPVAFSGTITPASVAPGGNITITAPAGVTFSATAAATGVTGPLYQFVSRSATTLVYKAASEGTGQKLVITGGILLGTIPLPALTSSATYTVTAPNEPADNAAATAPTVAMPAVVGDSTVVYGSISGTDVDDWWTLPIVVGDSVQIRVDWPAGSGTDLDIDMLVFRTNGTTGVSFAGGTGANPEVARARATLTTGGTWKIEVNMYDTHGHPQAWPYRLVIIKRA